MQKIICGMIIVLLMVSVFPLAFSIQLVKAEPGTVYIRADGSVDPPTAPISTLDNVTYTLTGNINDSIVVQRDNIVVNGAGHVLKGAGTGNGISLTGRSNVTIKSITIRKFSAGIYLSGSSGNKLYANRIKNCTYYGIWLISSSGNSMSANTITNSSWGIWLCSSSNSNGVSSNTIANSTCGILLDSSSGNSMSSNTITNSTSGIGLDSSSNSNSLSANNITNNAHYGILLISSSANSISANNLTSNNYGGVLLYSSSNSNSISANTIKNNGWGIYLYSSSNNLICHNNFMDNTAQAIVDPLGYVNIWDDGYPSGGNYWSDYTGIDLYKGPYQNVAGSDGIGDTPYVIDADNRDNYPLMKPWAAITNVAILVIRRPTNLTAYRTYNVTTDSWTSWKALPKATCDSPAAAICNNELHMVIRSLDGSKLYHGYVNLATNAFSGWKLISGSTPSAPTLTSNGTVLCLVIRGVDNRTRYRVYSFSPRSWGTWKTLARTTCDGAAAAMLGNNLHIVTRSLDGKSLWHIIVKPNAGVVRNWIKISGATPSKPVLTANQTANKLYLVVRRSDNKIQWRSYGPADTWAGWKTVPTGTTCDGPAATIVGNKLRIVIRSMTGTILRQGYIILATSAFSGWTTLSGSTPSQPTLAN